MQQQVNATARIIFSADAELEREELEARVRADVGAILGKYAPRDAGKLEAQSWELLELREEAAIYGNAERRTGGRLAELEQIATDCMESNSPGTVDRHKRAAQEARAAAACEHANARGFYRDAEARELLMAIELERPELTTADRLLVAAIMAARAEGEPLELGASAELLEAGDALAEAIGFALETHIYEPGEVPPDCGELLALERWQRLRAVTDETVAPYDTHAARLKAEGFRLSSDLDGFDVYRAPGGRRAWLNYQGGDDRFIVTRAQLEGDGSLGAERELGRRARGWKADEQLAEPVGGDQGDA
jgi:hypothetical protein